MGRPPSIAHRIPEAIAFYEAGHTFKETCEMLGCSGNTLKAWLDKAGYTDRRTNRCRMAKQIEEISAFYLDGRTLKETAEKYGTSERALRDLFHKHGIPTSYEERTKRLHKDGWVCPGCKRLVPREGWHGGQKGFRPSQYWCRECSNARRRERYHKYPERQRQYELAGRSKRPAVTRAYRIRLRTEMINHYGGKCACCGEAIFEFLALDHIHGGGRKHRLSLIADGVVTPEQYYKWIRDNGYPAIYRVLCHNCNLSLGFHKYCPHQGIPSVPDRKTLTKREKKRHDARRDNVRLRKKVLDGYGHKCDCCGESAYEFLAIDHVNGGGKRHAAERKEKGITWNAYLRSIIEEGFPTKYRLLCHNCNMARGFHRRCPHESA